VGLGLAGEDRAYRAGAAVVGGALNGSGEGGVGDQAPAPRLVDGAVQVAGRQHRGLIEDRARRGGHGQAVTAGAVLWDEVAHAVQADPGALAGIAPGHRDLDGGRQRGTQRPERTGRVMAQVGSRPAGQQLPAGGHPALGRRQRDDRTLEVDSSTRPSPRRDRVALTT